MSICRGGKDPGLIGAAGVNGSGTQKKRVRRYLKPVIPKIGRIHGADMNVSSGNARGPAVIPYGDMVAVRLGVNGNGSSPACPAVYRLAVSASAGAVTVKSVANVVGSKNDSRTAAVVSGGCDINRCVYLRFGGKNKSGGKKQKSR